MNPSEQFFAAIRNGDVAEVKDMLARQPELQHARDQRGSTPLVLATYLENLDTTRALVEAGADPDTKDGTGNTPLMGVCFKGNLAIARYLLERGANPSVRNATGGTALTFAAMFNRPELVELLLEHGADPGVRDQRGLSAADYAREQGLEDLTARLETARN
ncbi:ankyrin repeat domain-containing protein [Lewinella sp. JB7]|uniref:ankyrin repeat domain-containing protein n=1 Tax=Lewinella sp. JB7 TaxID=2962887 RepID=UPI0020C9C4B1|nr:ankyrin repeat domain-containing protein [Lewinella sp. JB7]MCP9237638.1 ankyrin repeat domain-containing protein [Lewinella sp. JB7]